MCVGMHLGMCADFCIDMHIDMCVGMHLGMRVGMCRDMCAEMNGDMCLGNMSGMCVRMCIDIPIHMCACRWWEEDMTAEHRKAPAPLVAAPATTHISRYASLLHAYEWT